MITRNSLIFTLSTIFVSLLLTSFSSAQDTLLISYQGRLTDNGGNPISGTPSMTFTIYDGAGVSKWTESHSTVQVDDGLFNVILGSQTALPDSVFDGDDRYLGITVGSDPEISPRTLLTSAPGAAVARKVSGDITTGEGEMMLRSSTGADSAIVFSADGTGHLMKINWGIPPDDQRPGLELGSDANSNFMRVNWCIPPDDQVPAFEVLSDGISESIEMKLGVPPDDIMPEIGFSVDQTVTAFSMNSPAGALNPDFQVQTTATGGPSMSFFDDVGRTMGVEPSPFNEGFSLKLIDPGDDKNLLEISSNYLTNTSSIVFRDPGGTDPNKSFIEMYANDVSGPTISLLDDVGKTMGVEPSPWNEGFGLKFYDPTQVSETELIALSGYYGDSTMARLQMFHPLAATPSATQIDLAATENYNRFKLGNISPDAGTSGMLMTASNDSATMYMGSGPGGTESVLAFIADGTSARIGVGNEAPSMSLVIGDNLGTFGGKRIVVGNSEAGTESGFVVGEDNDNRAWMLWNVDSNYWGMGTKESGSAYGSTLVLRSGEVGIGTNAPNYTLDVRGSIGSNTTLYHSDKRWKKDIKDLQGSLDRVVRLQGVQYRWKEDEYPEMNFPEGDQIGLIAQDVEKIIPEVVNESSDGFKSIEYAKLVSVLIESIKEQQQQITKQQDQLERLSKRVEELEGMRISGR